MNVDSNADIDEIRLAIDCRAVGPGGTTVTLFPTQAGVKAVWTNENCPYDEADRDRAALNESNVSWISWEDIEILLSQRPK